MLDKLALAEEGPRFGAYAEWFDSEPPERPLSQILGLEGWQANEIASWMLGPECPEGMQVMIQQVSRGIQAYMQFQDCLQITFTLDEGLEPFNRHYLYFESLVYLRESAAAWLSGNSLAACTLLRPFLELALSHAYWHAKCEGRSYKPYYKWLGGEGHKIGFRNMLEDTFKRLRSQVKNRARLGQLEDDIHKFYKALCSYNHTPRVDESLTFTGGGLGQVSYDNLYFYAVWADLVLSQVIFLFTLTYPAILFPVELHKKWGFGGPAGLLVDPRTSALVQHFLGPETTQRLQGEFAGSAEITNRLQLYNDYPDLTEMELEEDWKKFLRDSRSKEADLPNELIGRLTMVKAHYRALAWAMNYIPARVTSRDQGIKILREQDATVEITRLKSWF